MSIRILIVEDEQAIADTIAYALKTEGFIPVHCELGQDALRKLKQENFGFAILDVGLPDISGFDLCRKIREFTQIPVIFLTARTEETDRIVGLEIGADDYVAKPFSPRELVARVRAILRRSGSELSNERTQSFAVDSESRRIHYKSVLLDLTRYEYLLLKTLLARPDRIYTRAELMERVWSGAEETGDRTVDTHIKTLRAKLSQVDPSTDPIQTHRGLGYSVGRQA